MRRSLAFCCLVLGPAGILAQTRSGPGALAITNVTVINATGAPAQPDQTVLIKDGRIVALGMSADVPTPGDAQSGDGPGNFLTPGLWDRHAPTAAGARDYLGLYLANG